MQNTTAASTARSNFPAPARSGKRTTATRWLAENLEPGTKYVYRVGDASTGIWSNNGTFETACDGEEPFSFIALADVQAGNETNFTKSGAVQRTAMQVCPDAKFLMNAGDFVNDCNDQEWGLVL